MVSFGLTAGGERGKSGPAKEEGPILRGSGGFSICFFFKICVFSFFLKNKKGKSHMRKRTIRQRNEDRRRREYTEATIREESRREEKRRQVKMKEEKEGKIG